jgi:hypothetical protein
LVEFRDQKAYCVLTLQPERVTDSDYVTLRARKREREGLGVFARRPASNSNLRAEKIFRLFSILVNFIKYCDVYNHC